MNKEYRTPYTRIRRDVEASSGNCNVSLNMALWLFSAKKGQTIVKQMVGYSDMIRQSRDC